MNAAAGLPWYRHFWPWFVVGLLGISVIGSLTTVYIAVSGRDPEVADYVLESEVGRGAFEHTVEHLE